VVVEEEVLQHQHLKLEVVLVDLAVALVTMLLIVGL
tara:strand:- start:270 stop:377 length:108 start_codon:yes stop_codon:yes gene_type:complete